MSQCFACGYTVDCVDGCGIFCQNECTDCIVWCGPHTTAAAMRMLKQSGKETRILMRELSDQTADAPKYSETEKFNVCFKNVSRADLARVFGSLLGRSVRAPADRAAEKLSDSTNGTAAELAAKYSLTMD